MSIPHSPSKSLQLWHRDERKENTNVKKVIMPSVMTFLSMLALISLFLALYAQKKLFSDNQQTVWKTLQSYLIAKDDC